MTKRDTFGSRLGIVAAAAGSAIGLGNIWKFPYMAGMNGGSAFIMIYLLAIVLMGFPLVYAELALGRKAQTNAVDSYSRIGGKKAWGIIGFIATFYMMITGWVVYYLFESLTGNLYKVAEGVSTVQHFEIVFGDMVSSMWLPLIFGVVAIVLTGLINSLGIQKGVEKYSKIMMPILFGIFILLIIYSTTLSGFKDALKFLFKPDFSEVTPTVIISAIGQAFFSLSLGLGALVTYGSYISDDQDLRKIALQVSVTDTIIALFSGLLIFPAVFTYGLEPKSGPPLIFNSLPQVFIQMPGGRIFSVLFFLLVVVAAITSMVSMLEIVITFIHEKTHFSRQMTTFLVVIAVAIGGALNIAGEGPLASFKIAGRTIFENIDYLTNNITIPLVAVFTAILVTWVWKTKNLNAELEKGGQPTTTFMNFFNMLLKWVIPPVILLLMICLLLGVQA